MVNRRSFLLGSAVTAITAGRGPRVVLGQAPAMVTSERARPAIPYGVQSVDIAGDRAIVWARCDRSARLHVEWATTESFRDARRLVGPAALEDSDYTARVDLTGLPAGQRIFYRVVFQDLGDGKTLSAPIGGHVSHAARGPSRRAVRVVGR